MNPSITDRKPAKIRFFVIYTLSVFLIVLLFSSFLLPARTGTQTATATAAPATTNQRAVVVELLHRRMEPLQLATASLTKTGAPADGLKQVEKEKALFMAVVDSLRNETEDLTEPTEKAAVENLLQQFATNADREQQVATALLASRTSTARPDTTANAELDRLKTMLVQKEAMIAELQQQKPVVETRVSDAGAAEWKEKYTRLKASTEKTSSQLEAIKNSYREAVEDNRRLITQLQAVRAGKN